MPKGTTSADRDPLSPLYIDTGCAYHPSCLECPRPVCLHDDRSLTVRLRSRTRRVHLRRLLATGLTVRQAAPKVGVSLRTAFRLLGPLDKRAQTL